MVPSYQTEHVNTHRSLASSQPSVVFPPCVARLPQRVGEQPMADLLVPHKERTAVVLPGQGQEQIEPASRAPGGLQRSARPQPRAPVLLQDQHGGDAAGDPRGRPPQGFLMPCQCFCEKPETVSLSRGLHRCLFSRQATRTQIIPVIWHCHKKPRNIRTHFF